MIKVLQKLNGPLLLYCSRMAYKEGNFFKQYSKRRVNLRVLLDMDGVLCDFEGDFLREFKQKYPSEPYIELKDREGFYLRDQYDLIKPDMSRLCANIYNSRGFFKNLSPVPGSVDAAKEMSTMEGVEVFLCTSPLTNYRYCLHEKFHWVEKNLGKQWCAKVIIAKDKTMANGHLLIDDRPNIKGAILNPSWEHVVFTSCHNVKSNLDGKRRLDNWTDGSWRDLIEEFKKRVA